MGTWRGIFAHSLVLAVALPVLSGMGMGMGCARTVQVELIYDNSLRATWHSPESADLAAVSGATLSYGTVGASSQSYTDFRLVPTTSSIFLAGNFFSSGTPSTFVRTYSPYSALGSGWIATSLFSSNLISSFGSGFTDLLASADLGGSLTALAYGGGAITVTAANPTGALTLGGGVTLVNQIDGTNGVAKGYAPDLSGNSGDIYAGLNLNTSGVHSFCIFKTTSGSWPTISTGTAVRCLPATVGALAGLDTSQSQLLSDGLGTTAITLRSNGVTSELSASWSADTTPFGISTQLNTTSAGVAVPVTAFSASADRSGNVVVVFIQKKPFAASCSLATTPVTTGCAYRIYASVRSASGTWSGPTQLDVGFSQTLSTLQQSSTNVAPAPGGKTFATPAVAYVGPNIAGNGQFVAAFPVINNATRISGVYSRTYTVGFGWDSAATTVEEAALNGTTDQYRFANDLFFASDGAQFGTLVLHYVYPAADTSTYDLRNMVWKAYPFRQETIAVPSGSGAGWQSGTILNPATACPGILPQCANRRAEVAVFSTKETVVVYPAPDPGAPTSLRLYSSEFY